MSGPTTIYGYSDDNIAFEGGFFGEVGCYGTDDEERGVLLVVSDGTVLEVKYCGRIPGVWEVKLIRAGSLFVRIDQCDDDEADPYSDVAHFNPGVKWVKAATEWQDVR
jgi:hypothetical protein